MIERRFWMRMWIVRNYLKIVWNYLKIVLKLNWSHGVFVKSTICLKPFNVWSSMFWACFHSTIFERFENSISLGVQIDRPINVTMAASHRADGLMWILGVGLFLNNSFAFSVKRGKGKKKKKKALMKILLIGAVLKAKIELLLKVIATHLQIKFFVVALIGLMINIARFWVDLKRGHQPQKVFAIHDHSPSWYSNSPQLHSIKPYFWEWLTQFYCGGLLQMELDSSLMNLFFMNI